MWLLVLAGTVVLALYGTSLALRAARRPLHALPYESGAVPQQHALSRYHARWYAVTVVFLAFDMEMVFMYPWAVIVAEKGGSAVVEMFGFLAVLMVGVVYAWREGALRWS
ncbi:NADH-quinone oxidoreductase subunit A [Phytoactinopolyspora halotolerans]|uniref:NADH-quinone oxidoreductase subunit A n=1 Tax=Phytoactinopolyspora halotolerans TaxID=1981512 RepID=UPI0035E4621A